MKIKKDQAVAKQSLDQLTDKNELKIEYHKNKLFTKARAVFFALALFIMSATNVYAVNKIEGGDVTITSLGDIISKLAKQVQVFGIILSFIALVIFVIQFIVGDDETKQRKKKTILYTLGGVALLILVPSIINFVISTLE